MSLIRDCRLLVLLILVSGVGLGPQSLAGAEGDGKETEGKSVKAVQAHGTAFAEGVAKWEKGDLDGAVASFTKAIQDSPDDLDRLLARGLVYYDKRDLDAAIVDFTDVLTHRKDDCRALRARARAVRQGRDGQGHARRQGRADRAPGRRRRPEPQRPDPLSERQASRSVGGLRSRYPSKPQERRGARLPRPHPLRVSAQLDEAIADLGAALAIDPKNSEALRMRGRAYYEADDPDRALADLTEAVRLDPKDGDALIARGLVYYDEGDLDKAIADYTEAIRLDPESADAFQDRAAAYLDKADFKRALADCNQAVRLAPESGDLYACRARVLLARGEVRDARKVVADCKELIRRDASDAEAFFMRGCAHALLKKWPDAVADYTEAIRLDGKYAEAYVQRAAAYDETSEPKKRRGQPPQGEDTRTPAKRAQAGERGPGNR